MLVIIDQGIATLTTLARPLSLANLQIRRGKGWRAAAMSDLGEGRPLLTVSGEALRYRRTSFARGLLAGTLALTLVVTVLKSPLTPSLFHLRASLDLSKSGLLGPFSRHASLSSVRGRFSAPQSTLNPCIFQGLEAYFTLNNSPPRPRVTEWKINHL